MQRISQSLAGRVRLTSLLPFSLAELTRRDAPAMGDLLSAGPRQASPDGAWTVHAVRGFYPRIHDLGLDAGEWLAQYFQTNLERDVRDLTQVGDLEAFGRFVRLCAGRAGGLLNLSSLGNDCGVSHETARRWQPVLEASFVTFRLQPYHQSFNRRLTRRPKLYFVDTGLLCWLLRAAVAVGFSLIVVGLGLGVTMIMLPIGLLVGLIGVMLFVWGLVGHLGNDQ